MVDEHMGSEPSGWELMRALTAFKDDIKGDIAEVKLDVSLLSGKVVTVELYNSDRQGNSERHERAEARLSTLESNVDDGEKQKRNLRATLLVAIVVAIASPLVALFLQSIVQIKP